MPRPSTSTKSGSQPSFKRSLFKRGFYTVLWFLARLVAVTIFHLRCEGRGNFPKTGGGLVLSTHQSNFDPVLVGLTSNRRFNFLARKTLFKNGLFAWLIRTLDAIELDREGGGLAGLRETLARLKRGELVLIFPEGTRTKTGSMGELKPGFLAVARRSKVPLIPVAVVGAYDILPRGSQWPRLRPVAIIVGEVIPSEFVAQASDDEIMQRLTVCLQALDQRGRQILPVRCSS